MSRTLESVLAGAAVLLSTLPLHAQSHSTLRPSTDSSVTTGIGTGSTFRNVAPPPGEPPIDTSRKFMWDTPEANAKPQEENRSEGSEPGKAAAVPAPVPEVQEDPRTMITRDRIESPQH